MINDKTIEKLFNSGSKMSDLLQVWHCTEISLSMCHAVYSFGTKLNTSEWFGQQLWELGWLLFC